MNNLLRLTLIALLAVFFSCKGNQNSSQSGADTTAVADTIHQAAVYTCPMHPEVVSDKPGKCPTCGMDLEPKS